MEREEDDGEQAAKMRKTFIAAFNGMVTNKRGGKSTGNASGRGKDGGGKSNGCNNTRKGQGCINCRETTEAVIVASRLWIKLWSHAGYTARLDT